MKKLDTILIKSIFFLALPAIIEMGLNTLLGVSDTIMISRLINYSAVAASGYSNQIMYLLIFVFASFNTGAIAMISRAYGEKNYDKVNHIANQNLVLNLFIGVIITLISLITYPYIFRVYELSLEVQQYAFDYFTIIAWGMPFMFISFSISAALRGTGDTKTPMKIVAFSNLINIILNYLLITGFGIFPKMGIEGAALATSFSRFLAAAIYIYIFLYKNHCLKIKYHLLKFESTILKTLWRLSLPGALEQFFMHGSFMAAGVIVSQLTTLEEASFRILLNLESISFMPAVGISIATATLVGQALGEKNVTKSLHTGYIATGMGVVWGIFMAIIFISFPRVLLSGFTADTALINVSIAAMYTAAINQPFLNPGIILSGALRGAGDTRTVMTLVTVRLWLIFVPLTYLFIITLEQGVKGLWIAETISFLIFLPIIFKRFKNKEWSKIQI